MTRKHEVTERLMKIGINHHDSVALRRIAMTLHRWFELECGNGDGAIERNEETGIPYWYNANSRFLDPHDRRAYTRIPDRENGARKRLAHIMKAYPTLTAYVQGDPRGASLYILTSDQMIPGADVDSYYSRGIAVYK